MCYHYTGDNSILFHLSGLNFFPNLTVNLVADRETLYGLTLILKEQEMDILVLRVEEFLIVFHLLPLPFDLSHFFSSRSKEILFKRMKGDNNSGDKKSRNESKSQSRLSLPL